MGGAVSAHLRRPGPSSGWLHPTDIGPLVVLGLCLGYAGLWLIARPSDQVLVSYVGQLFGAESVLLLSISLVLSLPLVHLERVFDGLDHAALWHRRCAMLGIVLLVPHLLLSPSGAGGSGAGAALASIGTLGLAALTVWSVGPRWRYALGLRRRARTTQRSRWRRTLGDYDLWRGFHRLTGVFVAAGFLHGVLDATMFHASPVLKWSYLVIGAAGLVAYLYHETIARYFLPLHSYRVESVDVVTPGLVDISLTPLGARPLSFTSGQFVMLSLETKEGWQRHPFTVSSAQHDRVLRVSVRALGDFTDRLDELIAPGVPAIVGGPHGRFDRTRATSRQIWIAGGIGITPFLSWLRSLNEQFHDDVTLFYSNDGVPPFAEEIQQIAAARPTLRVELIDTTARDRLSTAEVTAGLSGSEAAETSVFLCGPTGMLKTFVAAARAAGVPRNQIHHENFEWR